VLRGEVAERVRAIVREECQKAHVDILQGHISPDHVHVMISIPPHVTISRLIPRLKGKSSYRLLAEFPQMRKRFWGRHVWARGSFCRSSGNVTDEVITVLPTSALDFSFLIHYIRRLTSIDVLTLDCGGHHDVSTAQTAQRFARRLPAPATRDGVS
jgi:REP element-mobilizing transposase RayT